MQRVDRWVSALLAVLGGAVVWSASSFPNVPGQKLGAGFLPMLVGAGLMVCAALLFRRSLRPAPASSDEASPAPGERLGAPLMVLAAVALYVLLSTPLGFLLVAPVCLAMLFRTFGQRWGASLLWAIGGTLVVHVAFYKLLRVPLPWGVLRPFY
ncbi:MAG: tripartite tricarboxylate transporter TctB family protein [Betaproteobacteria bacterium]|jgi:putative tricarboxylic transport membrane protein